jgi:hypothetical protein
MAIFGGQVWNILPSACHPEVAATAGGTYLCGTLWEVLAFLVFWGCIELDGVMTSELELLSLTEGMAASRLSTRKRSHVLRLKS